MQQMEIWLVVLFLSMMKFYAKQIFVLSSSMKLGPGLCLGFLVMLQRNVQYFLIGCPLPQEKMLWRPCPFKSEAYMPDCT